MTSERECYVYIVLPGETEFVTAGRFRVSETPHGPPRGEFVYGRRYLERPDAVEFDPVELRLADDGFDIRPETRPGKRLRIPGRSALPGPLSGIREDPGSPSRSPRER